jgi:DNA-binding response OmpR family regulator
MAEADATVPPVERLLEDIDEAFGHLSEAEEAERPAVRVLVVDDDERLAEITARGLRRLGFEADSTTKLPSSFGGAVPVVDLGILEGAGSDVLEAVRAARPIVVTGATDRASRAIAESLAASDYLLKPVHLDVLAAAIKRRTK